MGRVKGCVTENCIVNKKKTTYKEENSYCPKCGEELVYVCMKCYTQLSDDSDKLCIRCKTEKKTQKENIMKKVGVAGGTVATVVAIGIKHGKKVIKVVSKMK